MRCMITDTIQSSAVIYSTVRHERGRISLIEMKSRILKRNNYRNGCCDDFLAILQRADLLLLSYEQMGKGNEYIS